MSFKLRTKDQVNNISPLWKIPQRALFFCPFYPDKSAFSLGIARNAISQERGITMTDMERSRIVELQRQGYGYKKISSITGLPLNTVKSFCARHPVQIKELPSSNALCRNCLAPLEQTPHKRKRMFCSDACRMAWWNAHPERVQRKAYYTLTCRHCGKQFESYGNSHRVFCSRDCYLKFRRKEADHE